MFVTSQVRHRRPLRRPRWRRRRYRHDPHLRHRRPVVTVIFVVVVIIVIVIIVVTIVINLQRVPFSDVAIYIVPLRTTKFRFMT